MTKMCVIAESDPFILRLLQRFAEECGLQTVHARVGQDVMELVQRGQSAGDRPGPRIGGQNARLGRGLCTARGPDDPRNPYYLLLVVR